MMSNGVRRPAAEAASEEQWQSLAELPKRERFVLYENCFYNGDPSVYHAVSVRPITKRAEDDMELLSGLEGERYLKHFESGTYVCSRCNLPLYSSKDKYKGPCVWPSFRLEVNQEALIKELVAPYYAYKCSVMELYCSRCELFVGHCFEDGKEKGDVHPAAHWRH